MRKADFENEMKAILGADADPTGIKKQLEEELGYPLSLEEVVIFYRHEGQAAKSLDEALDTLSALDKAESGTETAFNQPQVDGVRIVSSRHARPKSGRRNLEDHAIREVMNSERKG